MKKNEEDEASEDDDDSIDENLEMLDEDIRKNLGI